MKCHCNQCRHEWATRGNKTPLACPRCKRYDWAEPTKRKKDRERINEVSKVPSKTGSVGVGPGHVPESPLHMDEPERIARDGVSGGDGVLATRIRGGLKSCPGCGFMSGHQKWCSKAKK